VVLLAEHKDVVESQLELVILNLIKDSLAFVVKSGSSGVEGYLKVFNLVHKEFENIFDVFLFESELRVIQVHEGVTLKNLKELIVKVMNQSSEKSDRSVVWVAVSTCWSQLSKLTKDLFDGLLDVLEIVG